jgi:nucleolar MIF4G domain-containing protein 1
VERIFAPARELPALAANLHWFLRRKVRKSKQVSDKDRRAIQRVGEKAQTAVHGLNVDGN